MARKMKIEDSLAYDLAGDNIAVSVRRFTIAVVSVRRTFANDSSAECLSVEIRYLFRH